MTETQFQNEHPEYDFNHKLREIEDRIYSMEKALEEIHLGPEGEKTALETIEAAKNAFYGLFVESADKKEIRILKALNRSHKRTETQEAEYYYCTDI